MGYVQFIEEDDDVLSALQAQPIGGVMRVHSDAFSLTTIDHPGDGRPVFGAEIPIEIRDTTCTFQKRRGDHVPAVSYRRLEFIMAAAVARLHGVRPSASLFVAELPLGQRRVHVLTFQQPNKRRAPVIFEDIENIGDEFASVERRAAASDRQAQKALQSCRINYFSSADELTASLSDTELANVASFEDNYPDHPRRRRDSSFALAVVDDPDGLRNQIMQDKSLLRSFQMTGEGRLNTPHNKERSWINLPPEVASLAVQHLDVAVRQAMCGAGLRHEKWRGRPVAEYAAYLFQEHLLRAAGRRTKDLIESISHRIHPDQELRDPSWDLPDGW